MAVPESVGEKLIFLDQLHREKAEGFFPDPLGLPGCFTMLCLHAMAGPEMSGSENGTGKEPGGLKAGSISGAVFTRNSGETRQSFLTLRNCELFRKSVKASHFFGREEELYDLKEMFFNSGKYLISGIGGIGKQNSCVSL